jgi:FkbM family methyltransferase
VKNNHAQASVIDKLLEGEKITLFDIGSRGGVHQRWHRFGAHLRVIGFEPDRQECQRLNEMSGSYPYEFRCLPYALGRDVRSAVDFHICKAPGCSSLYEPNTPFVHDFHYGHNLEVVSTVSVDLTTLENVVAQEGVVPDFIKVDTQGSELNILQGGHAILRDAKMLELEVEFNPQYKDQPLFSDVDIWLRDAGFLLLGLRRTYWRRMNKNGSPTSPLGGQIMHGDAIYYNAEAVANLATASPKDVVKFCVMLSAYKQDDFIGHLMSDGERVPTISQQDRAEISTVLTDRRGARLFLPMGLSYINIRETLDLLRNRNAVDWRDPDFF